MDVSPGLKVHPVESCLHRQLGQHAVLGAVLVAGGYVHGPTLVVERVLGVVTVVVPSLGHSQLHPLPRVHYGYGKDLQFVLASLEKEANKLMLNLNGIKNFYCYDCIKKNPLFLIGYG